MKNKQNGQNKSVNKMASKHGSSSHSQIPAVLASPIVGAASDLAALRALCQSDLDGVKDSFSRVIESRIQESLSQNRPGNGDDSSVSLAMKSLHSSLMLDLDSTLDKIKSVWESRFSYLENKIERLITRVDDLEQYGRRPCLIVHGHPEDENVTEGGDPLVASISLFLKNRLEVAINDHDIIAIHRLGPKRHSSNGEERPRPVIIKFTRMAVRDAIYRVKRRLKGTGILITESLTTYRKSLLDAARDLQLTCWTFYGNLFVLLPTGAKRLISTLSDLENLK